MIFETTLWLGALSDQLVDVEFDYQPAERMTRDHPGCDEAVDITSVKWRGVEVMDDLGQEDIDYLVQGALEHMEGLADQAAEDRAEDLRDE